MVKLHIYEKETGKYLRSQEPKIDVLETRIKGEPVYVKYSNSTELELPAYGKHELPFFIDGEWVVKGQYKNVEVYNTETNSFGYCYTDELAENQVFIDDAKGIAAFKENYQKYIVDKNFQIVENPKYETLCKLNNLRNQLAETDVAYNTVLETPVEYVNNNVYKPQWVVDGTYGNLVNGYTAGIVQFPIPIWDATKLEKNMVMMEYDEFGALILFLTAIQQKAFNARKTAQSALLTEIAKVEAELAE